MYVTDFFVSKYRAQSNQISNKQQSLNFEVKESEVKNFTTFLRVLKPKSLSKNEKHFSLLFSSATCYLYRRIFFLPSTRTGRPLNDDELFVVEEVVVFLLIQEQLAVIIHVYRDGGD